MSRIPAPDRLVGMHLALSPRPRVAVYADLFEVWGRVRHREVAAAYQLGYLEGPRPRPWRRRRPRVPLLHLVVDPPAPLELPGLTREPPPHLVLTVWGERLVSVRSGQDWMYVIDSDRPLPPEWLRLLRPPGRARTSGYAVVVLAPGRLAAVRRFRLADVDAGSASLVRVEDRRALSR